MSDRMPAVFVAHGAPTLALDPVKGAPLRAWGEHLPRPRAILVLSAHWQDAALTVGQTASNRIEYDFGGFPPKLYRVRYAAPPAPDLVPRVTAVARPRWTVRVDETRPFDHGVWVPLIHLFPAADVPVLQLALPRGASPEDLLALGAALAPLRDEGVLLMGSGNVVHNLGRLDGSDTAPPPCWADDFDAWVGETLAARDLAGLAAWRDAPGAALSVPTDEHLRPLLVIAGALAPEDRVEFPVTGFEFGNLSRRCVALG